MFDRLIVTSRKKLRMYLPTAKRYGSAPDGFLSAVRVVDRAQRLSGAR